MAAQSGVPRVTAFFIVGEEPDHSVSVVTSNDIWVPESFLQQCWYDLQDRQDLAKRGPRFVNVFLIFEKDKAINSVERKQKMQRC